MRIHITVEIPRVVCPECSSANHLYRAGRVPDTGQVWWWCYSCNLYFFRGAGDD
jgi:transposase-like protein